MVYGEWTGQSYDLRQVLQLERVIVGAMRDIFIIEARLFVVLRHLILALFKLLW